MFDSCINLQVNVVPCSEGRALVLPMSVPLGSPPEKGGALASHIATINVDISEARASSDKREEDRIDMLLQCSIEEVIQAEEKQHVIHNGIINFPCLFLFPYFLFWPGTNHKSQAHLHCYMEVNRTQTIIESVIGSSVSSS